MILKMFVCYMWKSFYKHKPKNFMALQLASGITSMISLDNSMVGEANSSPCNLSWRPASAITKVVCVCCGIPSNTKELQWGGQLVATDLKRSIKKIRGIVVGRKTTEKGSFSRLNKPFSLTKTDQGALVRANRALARANTTVHLTLA